jgi:protoporphyrinogen oxidase
MKIAILGAGFSGLLAAYLLEKEGINVSLFEKEEYLGGHCRTLVGKNDSTELGTSVFFSKTIKELLIDLQIEYTERLVYRNFLDENFHSIEYISK